MKARLKGFSDLQSNIDSAEASDVKRALSALKPDEYKSTIEELGLASQYIHGTHVAGIAVEGNPYARILTARIEFSYTLLPDPCPTKELVERDARNAQSCRRLHEEERHARRQHELGRQREGHRGGSRSLRRRQDRRTSARRWRVSIFDIQKNGLTKAFASAPDILFITAAGNSNQDASFVEDIPAGIVLPNLMTVGAVDRAGDEASFTSYGPTVVAHANGYQVESVIPGGEKLAESGTSMASPNVANLAAKILAVNPKLTPVQVIGLIRETSDRSPDGRRVLINPRKAVAAAEAKKG